MAGAPDDDFDIEVSSAEPDRMGSSAAEVSDTRYNDLCTAWAKRQHDQWVKERTDGGWRYGTTISVKEKTHPLLRPWHELPDQFRKVDTESPQGLLDLLNDQGFAIIGKSELESLLKLVRGL